MNTGQKQYLPEVDSFKGILIALIVLGHNTYLSDHYPPFFNSLYNFHFASFLLLPFIFFGDSVSAFNLSDKVVRYLVPHFLFFSLAIFFFYVFYVPAGFDEFSQWLGSVVIAVIISSEELYGTASGFRFFWFLPALLLLVVLRTAYFRGDYSVKVIALVLLMFVHLLLGFVPRQWLPYIPFSLPLVLFLFPPGLLCGYLWSHYKNSLSFLIANVIVFILCVYAGIKFSSYAGLAGDAQVYSINQPWQLLFHDIYLVSAFFGLFALAHLVKSGLFVWIGKRSLFIFLSHSFIWQFFVHTGSWAYLEVLGFSPLALVLSTFVITIAFAVGSSLLLEKMPVLYDAVFPKSYSQWPLAGFKD